MKAAYFVFGNIWLLVGLCLFLFRTDAPGWENRVTFLHSGIALLPSTLDSLVGAAVVAAIICFGLLAFTSRVRPNQALQRTGTTKGSNPAAESQPVVGLAGR